MDTVEFYSHEQQDEFVFNLFNNYQNGFFLDISCGNPNIGSNSYALEKYRGWQGFCFDISDCEHTHQWSQRRTSRFIQVDATSPALTSFLLGAVPQGTTVDYLSLDVDANGTNLALPALIKVLEAGIRFKAMTFEHECYIHDTNIRDQSRAILTSRGYVPLFEDVRLWAGGLQDDSQWSFEDWWIDPAHFDQRVLEAKDSQLYYFECVEKLKKTLGNKYTATHHCCRAWPKEYDLFWNLTEEQQLKDLLSKMHPRG